MLWLKSLRPPFLLEVLLCCLGGVAGGAILVPDPISDTILAVEGRKDLAAQTLGVLDATEVARNPNEGQERAVAAHNAEHHGLGRILALWSITN